MCYTIAYLENKAKKLEARYKGIMPRGWKDKTDTSFLQNELPVYYFVSGFTHPTLPVITRKGIELKTWGLIPFWVKDHANAMDIRKKTLNAVGETVFQKPSFRDAIRSRRCILPVSGFYEWRDEGSFKQPHFIKCKQMTLMSMGCVYDYYTDNDSGEIITGFSILTTPANKLMGHIHNKKQRMPLVIQPKLEGVWIDPSLEESAVRDLIRPFGDEEMEAYPVSRKLNKPREDRNTPDALNPVSYGWPGNTQTGLFDTPV